MLEIRIIGLGLALNLATLQATSEMLQLRGIEGTPGYLPPEAIYSKVYSNKSDVFSVGVILYQFITKRSLWGSSFNLYPNGNSLEKKNIPCNGQLIQRNFDCNVTNLPEYLIAYSDWCSEELSELLVGLLSKDPG